MKLTKAFLTFVLLQISLYSYSWERKSSNFDPTVYGGGTQNWQIKESKEGWLYYANNNGLLEFDGYNWTLYPMNNKIVRAIELGEDIIFAGGNNMFGYYTKNDNGVLKFTSLSNRVDKNWKGNVWSIYAIGSKVYYIDDHNIYIFGKDFNYERTIKCRFKIDCTLRSENNIYIGGSDEIALFDTAVGEIKATRYINLSNNVSKAGFKIVELLPYHDQLIVVTANSGIFISDDDKGVKKLSTAGDAFIAQNQIFQASIDNELFAIGSVQNGLLLLDLKRPDFFEIINQDNSLNNNTVLSTFFDRNRNLWIGLDNGISFINMDGAINPLFAKESPIGAGYCSQNYNGRLYLGTNQGLYTLDKGSGLTPILEAKGQIITLSNIHNTLFSCGDNNLFVIDGNQRYSINTPGFMGVFSVEDRDDILIATTYFGLKLLEKKNGKWIVAHDIKGLNVACKSGLTHFRNNEFWQANPDDDFVSKLIFDSEFKTVKVKRYYLEDNRVMNNSFINVVDFNPVVCTSKGLFKYASETENFVPYKELENFLDGDKTYEYFFVDSNRDIWYKVDGSLYFLPYSNNRVDLLKYYVGFESQLINGEENIAVLDSNRIVIGTYKGFSLVNKSIILNKNNSLDINIRWIKTVKDGITTSYTKMDNQLILPYGSNVISFAWGGHNLSNQGEVYFSYRLLGLDAEWSLPTLNHVKEYTNLKEGKYTFEVRTFIKGINDEQLSYDKILFEIQPPWFRSIWAYCFYFVLAMVFFFFLYQYLVRRQNKEIRKKQRKIEYQQLLLKEEARLKDEKIFQLEKEKLETDLQYKTQETTGYILNISRKNEMFDKIKTEAGALLKLIDSKGSTYVIRKRISDLIQDVNNNVKHDADFESFKSNFDIVHKDFFKILENKYPQLTQKDKTLCAYIKMNFVSKEIAPLLNISVRGVEINRYNLRKKMGLDRNINLFEYLNSLT